VSIADTVTRLRGLLSAVDGVQVYTETDAAVNLPAIVIAPPQLNWTRFNGAGPDQATFLLYVMVTGNGYAIEKLEPLIEQIADALSSDPNSAVTEAVPGSYKNSGADLPAYVLTLEANL
jgi:hypothetical protein